MRKTDSNSPDDWLAFARVDLEAIELLSEKEVAYQVCRSRLAECLEKTLKAALIRFGWHLIKTHDLVKLCDELREFSPEIAVIAQPECEALADAYFAERYPGFDLDDPEWPTLVINLASVRRILEMVDRQSG